jgi:hypothetical protein
MSTTTNVLSDLLLSVLLSSTKKEVENPREVDNMEMRTAKFLV